MEIKSRLVFLDTNIYEGKNFQFNSHSLKSFKKLVDEEQIRLLVTEPTIREVRQHIRDKSAEAVREVKKLKRSAMILRNTPDLPVYGIFEDLSQDFVEASLNRDFDEFLDSSAVEHVSIEGVSATEVFDLYFSLSAPFAAGEKRKEFPDAFVLLALNNIAVTRNWPIHVITNDRDMHRFSEDHPRLICSDSIDELLDAINKIIAIEPSDFAELAFAKVRDEAESRVHDLLGGITVDIVEMGYDFFDDAELENVDFSGLELVESNLISVDEEYCVYDLVFSVRVDTVEIIKDYDRSPFDHEDNRYAFVLESVVTKSFATKFSVGLVIGYSDRVESSIYIEEIDHPDEIILRDPLDVNKRQLDINGD